MSAEITKVAVRLPDYNIAAEGESVPCEPRSCYFCGKHICPATQKTYFRFPFTAGDGQIELCSVKCIREYYATDQYTPEKIKVIQKE